MPTDPSAVLTLTQQIASLAQSLAPDGSNRKLIHQQIAVAAEQLAIASREPDENVYYIATQVSVRARREANILLSVSYALFQIAHNAALRSIIDMGVFEEMPVNGSSIHTSVLATRLGVSEDLLGMLNPPVMSLQKYRSNYPLYMANWINPWYKFY